MTNLIATHNLTASNLLHAAKIGGLAAPSLAITKPEYPVLNFGEITLVAPLSMIDPASKESRAKVFSSDVYSSRYPSVVIEVDRGALDRFAEKFAHIANRLGVDFPSASAISREGIDAIERNPIVLAAFIEDQQIEMCETWKTGLPKDKEDFYRQEGFGEYLDRNFVDCSDLLRDEHFLDLCIEYKNGILNAGPARRAEQAIMQRKDTRRLWQSCRATLISLSI